MSRKRKPSPDQLELSLFFVVGPWRGSGLSAEPVKEQRRKRRERRSQKRLAAESALLMALICAAQARRGDEVRRALELASANDFGDEMAGILFDVVAEVYSDLGFLSLPAVRRALRRRRVTLTDEANCLRHLGALYDELYPNGATTEIERAGATLKSSNAGRKAARTKAAKAEDNEVRKAA